jgi:hypothetical protein
MARVIQPADPEDIPELARFLIEGFHARDDAEFAAPDVLRWKYFDPRGCGDLARSYVARAGGKIVGHVGICPTRFAVLDDSMRREVSSLHMIDWLGSSDQPGVGTSLLRKVHTLTATQFAMGSTEAAARVLQATSYENRATVPVFQRVFRPLSRLKDPGSLVRRTLLTARDAARNVAKRPETPRVSIIAQRVDAFGDEVAGLAEVQEPPLILTRRDPELLNHFLRHPRGVLTGWSLLEGDRLCGCAVLSVARRGSQIVGRVADCLLDTRDADVWHAAFDALVRQLESLGAELAQACGSTPWAANALGRCGFNPNHDITLTLRDRDGLIPRGIPFYLTFLEGDNAYT